VRASIAGIASIGAVVCGFATFISVADSIGFTPPRFLHRTPFLATLLRVWTVPVEFVAGAWFAAVAVTFGALRHRLHPAALILTLTTGAAVVAAGGCYWVVTPWTVWPVVIATVLAATVTGTVVLSNRAWLVSSGELSLGADPSSRVGSPQPAALIALVAAFVAVGALIHGTAAAVTRSEATARNARRWFTAQQPQADVALRPPTVGGVRVLAFIDYQMPSVRKFLQWVDRIATYRRTGSPVDLVVLSYPFNPNCGDAGVASRSPLGCECAYAVKLVERKLGAEAAAGLTRWFLERGLTLSPRLITMRLSELQVGDQWSPVDAELRTAVEHDVALAARLGVRTVPTIFVNGVQLPLGTDMVSPILEHLLGPLEKAEIGPKITRPIISPIH
jgi:hypothetical protein